MIKAFRDLVCLALSNSQKTVHIPLEMAGEILDVINKFAPLPPRHDEESLAYYCPDCGMRVYFQQKYCGDCGKKVDWSGK